MVTFDLYWDAGFSVFATPLASLPTLLPEYFWLIDSSVLTIKPIEHEIGL